MRCTWCKTEATTGGRLPANAKGKEYWPSCGTHAYMLDKLKLDPITVDGIRTIEKREAREAAKAR